MQFAKKATIPTFGTGLTAAATSNLSTAPVTSDFVFSFGGSPADVVFNGTFLGLTITDFAGSNNVLLGTHFDDKLIGNAGNEVLTASGGNNLLDGGDGIDTADYGAAPGSVTANLATSLGTNGFGGADAPCSGAPSAHADSSSLELVRCDRRSGPSDRARR